MKKFIYGYYLNRDMKLAGYVRVSTKEQSYEKQISKIKEYCKYKKYDLEIFQEKRSAFKDRPMFEKMMKAVLYQKRFDGIVVTDLDRLGRSVMHLSNVGHTLQINNKALIIIGSDIDTSKKEGKLMFNMLASIAEFERDIIRERFQAGKEFTGNYGGRKVKQLPKDTILEHFKKGASYEWLANTFNVSRSTIYHRLKKWGAIEK